MEYRKGMRHLHRYGVKSITIGLERKIAFRAHDEIFRSQNGKIKYKKYLYYVHIWGHRRSKPLWVVHKYLIFIYFADAAFRLFFVLLFLINTEKRINDPG